jgi:hypothetical protein
MTALLFLSTQRIGIAYTAAEDGLEISDFEEELFNQVQESEVNEDGYVGIDPDDVFPSPDEEIIEGILDESGLGGEEPSDLELDWIIEQCSMDDEHADLLRSDFEGLTREEIIKCVLREFPKAVSEAVDLFETSQDWD